METRGVASYILSHDLSQNEGWIL